MPLTFCAHLHSGSFCSRSHPVLRCGGPARTPSPSLGRFIRRECAQSEELPLIDAVCDRGRRHESSFHVPGHKVTQSSACAPCCSWQSLTGYLTAAWKRSFRESQTAAWRCCAATRLDGAAWCALMLFLVVSDPCAEGMQVGTACRP